MAKLNMIWTMTKNYLPGLKDHILKMVKNDKNNI
jgi:uncharacterized protein with HEPN domain